MGFEFSPEVSSSDGDDEDDKDELCIQRSDAAAWLLPFCTSSLIIPPSFPLCSRSGSFQGWCITSSFSLPRAAASPLFPGLIFRGWGQYKSLSLAEDGCITFSGLVIV